MDTDDAAAIVILYRALLYMESDPKMDAGELFLWQGRIVNAIRHLAYPDRDTYPKTRKGTKRNPVTR